MSAPIPLDPDPEVTPAPGTAVCHLDDLDVVDAKGFSFGKGPLAFSMFVVRRNHDIWAYTNNCPHAGGPLEFLPNMFLDIDRIHILCSRHGALFRFEDGMCISPPCPGKRLKPVPIEILDGEIRIAT